MRSDAVASDPSSDLACSLTKSSVAVAAATAVVAAAVAVVAVETEIAGLRAAACSRRRQRRCPPRIAIR